MPLLIDGHNLVAKVPDLNLGDPDDEARLVERLRRFQARTGKRLTVVFDSGLPGGLEPDLSTSKLQVVFAPTGQSADALIVARVRRSRDPRGVTVVTSDETIIAAVEKRGARVVRAETFADELRPALTSTESDDVVLSQTEVDEWLTLFDAARSESRKEYRRFIDGDSSGSKGS